MGIRNFLNKRPTWLKYGLITSIIAALPIVVFYLPILIIGLLFPSLEHLPGMNGFLEFGYFAIIIITIATFSPVALLPNGRELTDPFISSGADFAPIFGGLTILGIIYTLAFWFIIGALISSIKNLIVKKIRPN